MPRKACVIQITPVRLTRTSANDASVVRKMYLSIDPIVSARSPSRTGTRPPRRILTDPPRPAVPDIVSHYHPFDRPTKWLRHGALGTGLIIRACGSFATLGRRAVDGP